MFFTDDFVGVSDSKEILRKLIDVVHRYCKRLKTNVSKSAVMVFSIEDGWKWGQHKGSKVSRGIDFVWDVHLKGVLDNGKKKVNQLRSVISNRYISLSACRLMLLSVIRPSIECGSEIWEGNKDRLML